MCKNWLFASVLFLVTVLQIVSVTGLPYAKIHQQGKCEQLFHICI